MKRFLGIAAILAGCGSDPVDAEGTYSVAVTNRDNGCSFANWTIGESAANIQVVITQQDDNASATVTGGTGGLLTLWLGSNVFSGKVSGNQLDLLLTGTRAQTTGNCTWTVNGEIDARLNGDTLVGRINYVGASNDASDCTPIEGCVTYQDLNGTRPPR
jgi:hypothetical protein